MSYPAEGKHISFDGQFLHAAPGELGDARPHVGGDKAKEGRKRKRNGEAKRRTSFLVNIWLNWKPRDAAEIDAGVAATMHPPSVSRCCTASINATDCHVQEISVSKSNPPMEWVFSMGKSATVSVPDPRKEMAAADACDGESYVLTFQNTSSITISTTEDH